MGLGLEFQLMKKIHFGLQYAFKFVTLEKEGVPISFHVGDTVHNLPHNSLYGDWMNITFILGVNF